MIEKTSSSNTLSSRKCFKCHGCEHITFNYPSKVISFTKHGMVEKVYIEDLGDNRPEDEYHLPIDEGEMLVV